MRVLTDKKIGSLALATLLCLLAVLLAEAVLAPAAGWSATGSVQVTAVVGSKLDASFGDTGVTVKANVPWIVSADLPGGERFVVSGGPTAGYEVVLPEGATGAEVCAR
ncbi:hypothetical protein [Anaerosoma tenue]|uniref:hypothetical protein n=1 Tax=Anaerosoma tenue TaxID=2933588 RepID=UPI002260B147|nr:hypothetical protein [Anaerosoma tenue]MCK8115757.1 hypothetical protein [Anaerosoma tenue]